MVNHRGTGAAVLDLVFFPLCQLVYRFAFAYLQRLNVAVDKGLLLLE